MPTVEVSSADLGAGIGLLSLLVTAGLAASNGVCPPAYPGGAVRLNDQPVSDERLVVSSAALANGVLKLSVGKKKHVLVRPA